MGIVEIESELCTQVAPIFCCFFISSCLYKLCVSANLLHPFLMWKLRKICTVALTKQKCHRLHGGVKPLKHESDLICPNRSTIAVL